jgi:hypothetical protein
MFRGQRVYDERDIPALVALVAIAVRLEYAAASRAAALSEPQTAAVAHLREHGHALSYGCCSSDAAA